jgi:cobalt transporter subunit CbtA
MFNRLVLSAFLAGTIAGILLSVIQIFWVTPLILEAETYEVSSPAIANEIETAEEAWAPNDGWERTLYTTGSNIVIAFGFAIILTGFYNLFQFSKLHQGLAWGIAGYIAFFVSPALGLPPELPGTVAADLVDRQYWFLGTIFCTATGLMLIFLSSKWLLRLIGAFLVVMPHLIGAPQPLKHESLAPHSLITQFIWASSLSNALFWVALGILSLVLFRFFSPLQPTDR